jgi:hypothetical protein
MKRIAFLSVPVLFVSLLAVHAALPPLDESERQSQSTHIVVGRVEGVYTTVKTSRPGHENTHYLAEVTVRAIRKGAGVDTGSVLYAHYWRASRRPAGWAGSGGQRSQIETGDTIRLYLKRDNAGRFTVLDPNGAEPDTSFFKGVRG